MVLLKIEISSEIFTFETLLKRISENDFAVYKTILKIFKPPYVFAQVVLSAFQSFHSDIKTLFAKKLFCANPLTMSNEKDRVGQNHLFVFLQILKLLQKRYKC